MHEQKERERERMTDSAIHENNDYVLHVRQKQKTVLLAGRF